MSLIDQPGGLFAGGDLAIVGFIRNIGNETYDNVCFAVTLYDKNNTLIDVAEGVPSTSDATTLLVELHHLKSLSLRRLPSCIIT